MKLLAEVFIGIGNNKDIFRAEETVIAEHEIREVILENVLIDNGVTKKIVVPLGTKYR